MKCRMRLKLTHKTAKVTRYSNPTVKRVVAEKSALIGAAFSSPAKWYRKIVLDD